jgi:hypothetical protein
MQRAQFWLSDVAGVVHDQSTVERRQIDDKRYQNQEERSHKFA